MKTLRTIQTLKRKANKLRKEIGEVKQAHRRNEFARVNTYQLFSMEQRLKWLEEMIKHKEKHGE
jgi:hypothetical protein|nr:MAG TPA: hypothetical protein [Caudoviricetes sp.]